MVEPLEETRSELVFATEPVLSSLELSIPDSVRKSTLVELDEVEVKSVHPSRPQIPTNILSKCRFKKESFNYAKDFPSSIIRPD